VDLRSTMQLGEDDASLAWLVREGEEELSAALSAWFDTAHKTDLLAELDEDYYGHLDEFDFIELDVFRERIDTRLPKYDEYFRTAAQRTLFHWTLLAAQGYQESTWDPNAVSPTGVRGIMMLTLPTAREVGVTNRLDPQQSIEGGAIYLNTTFEQMPEGVDGFDRVWMALAAYNIGYGHLLDARRLARRQGLDPNEWHVLEETLPLLSDEKYYSTVRHGYARGGEPVQYVERIRNFHEVLAAEIAGTSGRPPLFIRPWEPVMSGGQP
jgi:membrane-bound lytic murein transglycosylase F